MLEQKTTQKEELFRAIFKETIEALRLNAANKKSIIRNCCSMLEEKGMPLEMICGRVMKELADFASRKYFFETIEQKYKDSQKIRAYTRHEPEEVHRQEEVEQTTPDEQKIVEEDSVIWQIPVAQYRIEDVEKYDRKFLIELVKYLHNRVENLTRAAQQ